MKKNKNRKPLILLGAILLFNIVRIGEYIIAYHSGNNDGEITTPFLSIGFVILYTVIIALLVVIVARLNLFPNKKILLLTIILTGIIVRFLVVPPISENKSYDFVSWTIIAKIVDEGGNVYTETTRYNYGPVWFTLLHIIYKCATIFSNYQVQIFRYIIVGVLSLTDIGIFILLYKRYNLLVGCVFLFHPLSILVTGCHNQFDNLAIFLGLCAVVMFGENFNTPLNRRKLLGILLLGLSLLTKHILFLFPFWLALKQHGVKRKIVIILIPTLIFLVGFFPYWSTGKHGIVHNVFQYTSFDNQIFYNLFIPTILQSMFSNKTIWFGLLIFSAFVFRTKTAFESLLLYLCVLLIGSPAIAGQYLIIVVPLIAVYHRNPFFIGYTIVGSWFFIVGYLELFFFSLYFISFPLLYSILISLLCLGLLWMFAKPSLYQLVRTSINEIRIQLEGDGF
jgi:hypothetical protein